MELNLVNVKSKKRYEVLIDDSIAFIDYIIAKEKIYLTHTEVPKSMAGKGIGSALALKVLEDIERQNLILVPLCPFVASCIKRHPEWNKLVLKGSNVED